MALQLRHERYYSKPTYSLERNIADDAIFSVSPPKNKNSKDADAELGSLVIDNGGAMITHADNKALTIQDAKLLIVIHKIWEEKGQPRLFEVPTHYPLTNKNGSELDLIVLFPQTLPPKLFPPTIRTSVQKHEQTVSSLYLFSDCVEIPQVGPVNI